MKKILYVEDNIESRLLVRRILENRGFQFFEAGEAREAMALLDTVLPDLILMDINLPGLNGYEAATRIRSMERFSRIPIVALTAKALEGDRARGLISGCSGYIAKPIDVDTFTDTVVRYLDGENDVLSPSEELACLRQYTKHLIDRLEEKIDISLTDELTGVGNLRYAELRIGEELARCRRYEVPASILLCDIDSLKSINQAHGYDAGNHVLKEMARLLSSNRRRFDVLARFRKDEFLLFLYNVNVSICKKVGERIIDQVASESFSFGGEAIRVSVTVRGGSVEVKDPSVTVRTLLDRVQGQGDHPMPAEPGDSFVITSMGQKT